MLRNIVALSQEFSGYDLGWASNGNMVVLRVLTLDIAYDGRSPVISPSSTSVHGFCHTSVRSKVVGVSLAPNPLRYFQQRLRNRIQAAVYVAKQDRQGHANRTES